MIRRKDEQQVEFKCIRNGIGEAEMHKILNGADEMLGKGRMFNHMILAAGNTIGEHYHSGDSEFFYFLSGEGEYNDNGTVVTVKAGDTAICLDGQMHGLKNLGDTPLEFIALILYS